MNQINMIGIIDYNAGNIGSLTALLQKIHATYQITNDVSALENCSHIILPGVGSFSSAMEDLRKNVDIDRLLDFVESKKIPFLGICLGMQLMADWGYEGGKTKGLGIIAGEVVALKKYLDDSYKLPHIGWNDLKIIDKENNLVAFDGLDFYHIHSFFFSVSNSENLVAYVDYGLEVPVIIEKDNFIGVQFHPEKSQHSGQKLIEYFLSK